MGDQRLPYEEQKQNLSEHWDTYNNQIKILYQIETSVLVFFLNFT